MIVENNFFVLKDLVQSLKTWGLLLPSVKPLLLLLHQQQVQKLYQLLLGQLQSLLSMLESRCQQSYLPHLLLLGHPLLNLYLDQDVSYNSMWLSR